MSAILVTLSVYVVHPAHTCVCTRARVSPNTGVAKKNVAMSCARDGGDVIARHLVATFYKSCPPRGMFNLSKSRGRSQLQRPFVKVRVYAKRYADDVAHALALLTP